jgi:hypothetical protein
MKTFIRVLLVIFVVMFVMVLARNVIIKTTVEKIVKRSTGLELKVEGLNLGITDTTFSADKVELFNPGGFSDRIMMDIPGIYVNFDLSDALSGKIHLYKLRIDLKEFVVVKNKDGKLNLDYLNISQPDQQGIAGEGKIPELQIDVLFLKVGRVTYKDYSRGAKPVVKEYVLNIDGEYRDITDLVSLTKVIMAKALMSSGVADLVGYNIQALESTTIGMVESAGAVTSSVMPVAAKTVQNTTATVEKAIGSVGGAVAGLEKSILPFGSSEDKKAVKEEEPAI